MPDNATQHPYVIKGVEWQENTQLKKITNLMVLSTENHFKLNAGPWMYRHELLGEEFDRDKKLVRL